MRASLLVLAKSIYYRLNSEARYGVRLDYFGFHFLNSK